MSEAGSAWAMAPPIVPRLRTWTSPIVGQRVLEQAVVARRRVERARGTWSGRRSPAGRRRSWRMPWSSREPADVDERLGRREPQLEQRQQALAAGEDLGRRRPRRGCRSASSRLAGRW